MAQINKPSDYFNTVLYTGNGSTQSITGVGFQPDFTWIKNRSATQHHQLFDAVRGATKRIYSSSTAGEDTATDTLTSFDSDGFSLGANNGINGNGNNIVSWNWLANGSGSSNTDGNITSTVSVNTTSGISIGTYSSVESNTGKTVGHGLGVKPDMVMVKKRSGTAGWVGWHQDLTGGNEEDRLISLNSTAQSNTITDYWGSGFNSTTFGLWDSAGDNSGTGDYWFWAFKSVKGYSEFGSYTGNGSSNGAFVYTGFKPALVIFKRSSGTGNWQLLDSKRIGYNVENRTIYPNSNIAEQDENDADILSNGFKLRGSGTDGNGSGSTYIYMAFAETPLVGTNNIPTTAR